MATLHTALKALGPITFSDLPTETPELESWLSDLFSQTQVIIDSIPIADAPDSSNDPKSSSSSVASNASEITLSSARPPEPVPENQALQKEWGKPVKLGAKENALGMSVYKMSGKDGRGAWFARRSVHEGISYSRFKKALEMEFPESLAVQGAPGEGNVRGIGGETKVEDIKTSNGRVEVYRLSAQFPGPTTPRDFVTMLVTSGDAMEAPTKGGAVLRHHLIVSKPCDHPETQPQNGFIRGFYESVEFIREIPKYIKTSQSTSNLPTQSHEESISKDAMIRNANQKTKTFPIEEESANSESIGDVGRKRSHTAPDKTPTLSDTEEPNPVEWIMITRSDPGGSVPRFMVERGTPGSICADAEKFLNWACKQDFDEEEVANAKDTARPSNPPKRESFQSFRSSRMAGVRDELETTQKPAADSQIQAEKEVADDSSNRQQPSGIMGAVSGAAQYLSAYTPQVVLDRLPRSDTAISEQNNEQRSLPTREDDATSVASFESADSHITSSESEIESPDSSRAALPRASEEHLTHHEKEIRKLERRRAALENKFSESRARIDKETTAQSAKEEQAKQKAIEKHEREVRKHKEKYEKELERLDRKQEKERKKMEAKKKKQADKDEKHRLTRERDEARQELDIVRKEAAVLRSAVEDLQRQNTTLVAKLGKAGLSTELSSDEGSPSIHSSNKSRERALTGADSASVSIKSQ